MYRHIPFTILALGVCISLGALVLLIGGLLAGWDVWSMLTSPTASLIYLILFTIVVVGVFKYFIGKDDR
jgi:hypothetical protein